jgi:hypothetical protein
VLLDAPGTLVVDCMEHAQVDKEDRVVVLVAPLQSSACSGNAETADHHFKRLLQDAQHSTIVVVNSVSTPALFRRYTSLVDAVDSK